VTKEFYQYQLENHQDFLRLPIDPISGTRLGTREYLPMFDIGYKVNMQCQVRDLLTIDEELDKFDKIYGVKGWKSNEAFITFLRKAIQSGEYTIPLLAVQGDEVLSTELLVSSLKERARSWATVSPRADNIDRYFRAGQPSMEAVFRDIILSNKWTIHRLRRPQRTDTREIYLTNFMFLASLGEGSVSDCLAAGTYKPLFSLMVKRENMGLVKSYFITNTAVPSGLVELWIDESLEGEGSKLKPVFRKLLKSKLEASGVQVKYFSDLGKEIIRTLSIPKFRTVDAREKWMDQLLDEVYDVSEGKLGHNFEPIILPIDTNVLTRFEETMKKLITN